MLLKLRLHNFSMYKPVQPKTLKKIVEQRGYELVAEDDSNWIMESGGHVIVICQTMDRVPEDIIESMLGPSGIDEKTFFSLLAKIEPSAMESEKSATPPPAAPLG